MKNLRESAKQALKGSPIMEGREKMSVDEIIRKYPKGITITSFDVLTCKEQSTGEDKIFPVLTFKEEPDKYFYGGYALNKIIQSFMEEYNGDIAAIINDMNQQGGLEIVMRLVRTKKGNNYVEVEIK